MDGSFLAVARCFLSFISVLTTYSKTRKKINVVYVFIIAYVIRKHGMFICKCGIFKVKRGVYCFKRFYKLVRDVKDSWPPIK